MLCISHHCEGVQVASLRSQSSLTPDHRYFSRVYSPLMDDLRMVTVHRCGRSGILAARFTFVPHPIRPVTRATLLYIRGVVWNMVLFYFWPELSFSSLRCRFLYPCGLSYQCLRLGVSWKLNRPRPISFTSLPGRPFLPCFVLFKICMLRLDVLGKPRFIYE